MNLNFPWIEACRNYCIYCPETEHIKANNLSNSSNGSNGSSAHSSIYEETLSEFSDDENETVIVLNLEQDPEQLQREKVWIRQNNESLQKIWTAVQYVRSETHIQCTNMNFDIFCSFCFECT